MTMCRILLTRSMLPVDLQYIRDGLDGLVPGRYELIVPPALMRIRFAVWQARQMCFSGLLSRSGSCRQRPI